MGSGRDARRVWWVGAALWLLAGCAPAAEEPPVAEPLTNAELLDPQSCAGCHPVHYDQWAGSMHAYASHDPVFRAMNAKGQRETDGELGDFCVKCHAPMALATGATTDGLNLDEVPNALQGVTCVFCHSVEDVAGTHNNPLILADDLTMRGGIEDPIEAGAHASVYSPFHDRDRLESSAMCGSCHDVVLDNGIHLEATYLEWRESVYADSEEGIGLSCGSCHMRSSEGQVAALPGAPVRRIHDHSMPGVDIALTPWPDAERQRELVQRSLDITLLPELCVFQSAFGTEVRVTLENIGAGHAFPSGAAHDRRVWVEVIAYRDGVPIWEIGTVEDGEPVRDYEEEHPEIWTIGDRALKADGSPAHQFWEVHTLISEQLNAPVTTDPSDPRFFENHESRTWGLGDLVPDRVTMRVRIRPIGLEVLDDLIASGDLDVGIRAQMPTFTLGSTQIEWQAESGGACTP